MRSAVLVVAAACGHVDFDTGATLAPVQTPSQFASSQVDTVSLAPTHPGNTIIVATANIDTGEPLASISDDAGNTYVSADATYTCASTTLGELWFAAGARSATSVTITNSASVEREIWVLEASGPIALDTASEIDSAPESGTAATPVVRPSRVPALVISEINVNGEVTAVSAGFTALPVLHGDQTAYSIVTMPGSYGATFTSDETGIYCAYTAAFALAP